MLNDDVEEVEITTGILGTLAGINIISSNIVPQGWCQEINPYTYAFNEKDVDNVKKAKNDKEIRNAIKNIKILNYQNQKIEEGEGK